MRAYRFLLFGLEIFRVEIADMFLVDEDTDFAEDGDPEPVRRYADETEHDVFRGGSYDAFEE